MLLVGAGLIVPGPTPSRLTCSQVVRSGVTAVSVEGEDRVAARRCVGVEGRITGEPVGPPVRILHRRGPSTHRRVPDATGGRHGDARQVAATDQRPEPEVRDRRAGGADDVERHGRFRSHRHRLRARSAQTTRTRAGQGERGGGSHRHVLAARRGLRTRPAVAGRARGAIAGPREVHGARGRAVGRGDRERRDRRRGDAADRHGRVRADASARTGTGQDVGRRRGNAHVQVAARSRETAAARRVDRAARGVRDTRPAEVASAGARAGRRGSGEQPDGRSGRTRHRHRIELAIASTRTRTGQAEGRRRDDTQVSAAVGREPDEQRLVGRSHQPIELATRRVRCPRRHGATGTREGVRIHRERSDRRRGDVLAGEDDRHLERTRDVEIAFLAPLVPLRDCDQPVRVGRLVGRRPDDLVGRTRETRRVADPMLRQVVARRALVVDLQPLDGTADDIAVEGVHRHDDAGTDLEGRVRRRRRDPHHGNVVDGRRRGVHAGVGRRRVAGVDRGVAVLGIGVGRTILDAADEGRGDGGNESETERELQHDGILLAPKSRFGLATTASSGRWPGSWLMTVFNRRSTLIICRK